MALMRRTVVVFLDACNGCELSMTGAVVPWSRPTTCTSWLPDDVSVKATTVAGSGLIALAVAMPRRPMPGAVEVPMA